MPGRYYDDLEVGQRIRHSQGRTVTEADNVLFCALTMNTQPLHINEDFAAKTQFGQRIVNGIFTLGLVVGLTVSELTEGTIVANLGYERVRSPEPGLPRRHDLRRERSAREARPRSRGRTWASCA